jgi:DNA-binding Lrp family transcriptional regulator
MTDELDTKILRELKKNSRSSNVEIAKAVGLTEGAVRKRIQTLIESKVIERFTVELSSGAEHFAVVMVKAKGETKKMMAGISSSSLAHEAYEVSGEYDACVILSAPTMEELDSKIDSLRGLPSVADTKTFVSFKRWSN